MRNPKNWSRISLLSISICAIMVLVLAFAIDNEVKTRKNLEIQLESLQSQLQREENAANIIQSDFDSQILEAKIFSKETMDWGQKAIFEEVVCSEVNHCNNQAHEAYDKYLQYLSSSEEKYMDYKEKHEKCLKTLNKIQNIQEKLNFDEENFSELTIKNSKYLEKKYMEINLQNSDLIDCISLSDKKAEELFNEYYNLMIQIVNGEAGASYYPDIDQFYVMNVVENRIRSKYYPNTIEEVIFQPGQYQPTWDGSWGKETDERVKINVENYLKGKVTTNMPQNVLYQAMFRQGDGIWQHVNNSVDKGHYYCIKALKS